MQFNIVLNLSCGTVLVEFLWYEWKRLIQFGFSVKTKQISVILVHSKKSYGGCIYTSRGFIRASSGKIGQL